MMRTVAVFVLAVLSFLSQPAFAEKRVALVMGNSAYEKVTPLSNPTNDANAMSAMLKAAGFDVVTLKLDLKVSEMRRALRDFSDTARNADVAIVYFAGHGVEIQGVNYLIPVDAVLERDIDAFDEAVPLDRVLMVIEPAKKLRLVILDACRDNPFRRTMRNTLASRGAGRGLIMVEPASPNTMIAYAAKAGSTAIDGDDRNSPFTGALVKYLPRPGLDLRKAFGFVRDDVLKATGNRQEPFVYGSLGGDDVALVPAVATAPPVASPPDPYLAARRDYELALQINVPSAWDSFIGKYPSGFYTDLAKAQRDKLVAAQAAASEEARLAASKKALEEARATEAERAKAAAEAKAAQDAKIAADRAKAAEQAKAAREREAFEKQKALEEAKAAEAARTKAAEEARAAQDAKTAAEKARAVEAARAKAAAEARAAEAMRLAALTPDPKIGGAIKNEEPRPKAADSFKDCEDCPDMVTVAQGEVLMGSNRTDIDSGIAAANEGPQHRAIIKQPFAVGRFEVTRDQYAAFARRSGYKVGERCFTFENNLPQERANRSFLNPGFVQDGTHPAVCVSWTDAKAYVQWLSQTTGKPYRLLSEAEFEYAARAGGTSRFGVSNNPDDICNFANGADQSAKAAGLPANSPYMNCKDGYPFTAPVGSYPPNAFGLHDLIGNVWEWTEDCFYNDYASAKPDSAVRTEPACPARTVRGGDWFSSEAALRPAARAKANADARHDDIGFRVARSLAP
jgi:formylglycine-generating enzyme required for sulfatase activity